MGMVVFYAVILPQKCTGEPKQHTVYQGVDVVRHDGYALYGDGGGEHLVVFVTRVERVLALSSMTRHSNWPWQQ